MQDMVRAIHIGFSKNAFVLRAPILPHISLICQGWISLRSLHKLTYLSNAFIGLREIKKADGLTRSSPQRRIRGSVRITWSALCYRVS